MQWVRELSSDEPESRSPALVLACVQALDDTTLTAALASGGREHYGWGQDRHLSADIFDAINQGTRATGNWGKKGPPAIPGWPRPKRLSKDEQEQAAKPTTVADLFAKFTGGRSKNG